MSSTLTCGQNWLDVQGGHVLTGEVVQRQCPFVQIEKLSRIRQIAFLQAVDLDAVLAEARVKGFDCHVAQVGQREAPFHNHPRRSG